MKFHVFRRKRPHSGPEQSDICQHICPHSLSKSRCSHSLAEAPLPAWSWKAILGRITKRRLPVLPAQSFQKPLLPQPCWSSSASVKLERDSGTYYEAPAPSISLQEAKRARGFIATETTQWKKYLFGYRSMCLSIHLLMSLLKFLLMYSCMYVLICVFMYASMHSCAYLPVYIYICIIWIYAFIHLWIYVCIHLLIYVWTYGCMRVFVYLFLSVLMYLCIYVFTYLYIYQCMYLCIMYLYINVFMYGIRRIHKCINAYKHIYIHANINK